MSKPKTLEASQQQNCKWKVKYADEFSAMQAYVLTYPRSLRTINRRQMANSLTLYICGHCGYIHLSQKGTKFNLK